MTFSGSAPRLETLSATNKLIKDLEARMYTECPGGKSPNTSKKAKQIETINYYISA